MPQKEHSNLQSKILKVSPVPFHYKPYKYPNLNLYHNNINNYCPFQIKMENFKFKVICLWLLSPGFMCRQTGDEHSLLFLQKIALEIAQFSSFFEVPVNFIIITMNILFSINSTNDHLTKIAN